jgi:hypothetical protein
VRTLIGREGTLDGAMEMRGLVESSKLAQARAFGFQTGLDVGFILNVDEIRRHVFLRQLRN